MGIRRVLTGAVLGLAGSALLALPAAAAPAEPYGPDPTPGNLGVSTTTVQPGEAVTVSGSGFAPNSTVTITVTVTPSGFGRFAEESAPVPMGSLLAAGTTRAAAPRVQGFAQSVTTDASGSFTAQVVLTQAGTNVITATGIDPAGNTRTLTTVVFVAAAGGVGGDGSGDGSGSGAGAGNGSGSDGGSASGVGGLPNTGADLMVPLVVGGALVLLGGGVLAATRRRNREKVAA